MLVLVLVTLVVFGLASLLFDTEQRFIGRRTATG
jgi:hypothetical protein